MAFNPPGPNKQNTDISNMMSTNQNLLFGGFHYDVMIVYVPCCYASFTPYFHQHGMGSVSVCVSNFEPFGAFLAKTKFEIMFQVGPNNSKFSLTWSLKCVNTSGRIVFIRLEKGRRDCLQCVLIISWSMLVLWIERNTCKTCVCR